MKKIFFALAALMLAFTGCGLEDGNTQTNENKAVKVVVNMDKPGFGEGTRAARQGWEEGDLVGIIFNNDFEHVFFLTYSESASQWESELFFYKVVEEYGNTYYLYEPYEVDENYDPAGQHEVKKAEYLSSLGSGTLKAIYCSSGLSYFDPILDEDKNILGTKYLSISEDDKKYDEGSAWGECIMTCENGTYSVNDGELVLNITMKPQVAQFTIRDLDVAIEESPYLPNAGKTSDGLEVGIAGGNIIAYAGGRFTADGIELNRVNENVGFYNPCWAHANTDGISIYASIDEEDGVDSNETYTIYVGNYSRDFSCETYVSKIKNGVAIIMDGPKTEGAESKWQQGE